MGFKIENHPVSLRFLGAVDGRVVPSGTILSVQSGVKERSTKVLIDSGSAIREETPEGRNMDSLSIPSDIDAIVITHSHTDHCGALPEVVSKNPTAPVFAPDGNKHVIKIIAHEALKRSQSRDIMKEIREWREENRKIVKRISAIEEKFQRGVKRGRKGRTKITKTHEEVDAKIKSLEIELEMLEGMLFSALGISQYSVPEFLELLGKNVKHPGNYDITEDDLFSAIDVIWKEKLQLSAEQGFMTAEDVDEATSKIQEIQFNTKHKIVSLVKDRQSGGDITINMGESGHTHTVPSAQVFFEVPVGKGKKIGVLFSGDRGSSQLRPPYSQADDKGLENKADVLVLESTYGNRVHKNREEALQKLDKIVLEAIERGEDIIFPTISLDRPMMVMYEIVTRLLKKNPQIGEKVDISHFGVMMERILGVAAARKHPMEKEIRKFWKRFSDDQKKMLVTKGKKSRFIFAGGGFLPKNGSPAGAILEFALEQPDLNVLIPNYHGGPGSNADNMIHGREFLLTKENPHPHQLERGQNGAYIEGFSGHEDGPGLVNYARKVMKDGGTIYLNHGSESARQALYLLLINDPIIKQKHITVVLPTTNQEYTISTSQYTKIVPQTGFYKEKNRAPEHIRAHMSRRLHSKMNLTRNQKRFFPNKRKKD